MTKAEHRAARLASTFGHRGRWRDLSAEQRAYWIAAEREEEREREVELGWPAADGREPGDEHREHCAEYGHAPDYSRPPRQRCARCGDQRPLTGIELGPVSGDGIARLMGRKLATPSRINLWAMVRRG